MNYILKTSVYLMDEGPEGAIGLFLIAILGLILFVLGTYMDNNVKNSWLSAFGNVFVKKIGIALILTGIFSGIISLI